MATKPKPASGAGAEKVPAGQVPGITPGATPADPAPPRTAAKAKTFDKAVAALKQDVETATGAVPAHVMPAVSPSAETSSSEPLHAASLPAGAAVAFAAAPAPAAIPMVASPAVSAAEPSVTPIKQGVSRAMKTAEQLAQFHQGNMEAIVKSSQIWATGLQDLSKHVASNAQATMEETISTFRAMTSVKSLKEAFELQSSFARASMEKAMSESSKLTETGLKLAEQAYAPITARVNAAVEVFTNRG
jgi:phasin family protein